jgi:hypothetical protein
MKENKFDSFPFEDDTDFSNEEYIEVDVTIDSSYIKLDGSVNQNNSSTTSTSTSSINWHSIINSTF